MSSEYLSKTAGVSFVVPASLRDQNGETMLYVFSEFFPINFFIRLVVDFNAFKSVFGDDDMIYDIDAYDLARLDKLPRDRDVGFAWTDASGRVVMGKDERCGVVLDSRPEDFAGVDDV